MKLNQPYFFLTFVLGAVLIGGCTTDYRGKSRLSADRILSFGLVKEFEEVHQHAVRIFCPRAGDRYFIVFNDGADSSNDYTKVIVLPYGAGHPPKILVTSNDSSQKETWVIIRGRESTLLSEPRIFDEIEIHLGEGFIISEGQPPKYFYSSILPD